MSGGSRSRNETKTTTNNTTDVFNTSLGSVGIGATGVAGNDNTVLQYDYAYDIEQDIDNSVEYDMDNSQEWDIDNTREMGDVESGGFAAMGNTGTINVTDGRAFDIVESVALSAIDGIQQTSREALNETVEGLSHINAGIAKNDSKNESLAKVGIAVAAAVGLGLAARSLAA